jgi:hypothetical protein
MGYRLKYPKGSLKIVPLHQTPSGKVLKKKYAIVQGSKLISACRGISKTEANKQIKKFYKLREYKFP